jgi:hypothetical protein
MEDRGARPSGPHHPRDAEGEGAAQARKTGANDRLRQPPLAGAEPVLGIREPCRQVGIELAYRQEHAGEEGGDERTLAESATPQGRYDLLLVAGALDVEDHARLALGEQFERLVERWARAPEIG